VRKGDLLFFDTEGDGVVNHVGIYAGYGMLFHTNNPAENIHMEPLADKYQKWLTGIRRVL